MGEIALNGAGADDGNLDDEVVKIFRLEARQGGHLRAAFDLEDADGVGFAQHGEGFGVVLRQGGEIDGMAARAGQFHRVLQDGHHAQAEQIDFDDTEIFAVILVPLSDDAAGHRGVFQRNHRAEAALRNNHAAGKVKRRWRGNPCNARQTETNAAARTWPRGGPARSMRAGQSTVSG